MTDKTVALDNEERVVLLGYEDSLIKHADVIKKKGQRILEDLWPIASRMLYRHEYETFTDYCKNGPLNEAYKDAGCLPYFWDMVGVVNVVLRYIRERERRTVDPVTGIEMGLLRNGAGEYITAEWIIRQDKIIGKLISITPKLRDEKKSYAERDSYVLAALGIIRPDLTQIVDDMLEDEDGEPTEAAEDEYGLIPMLTRISDDGTYDVSFREISVNQIQQIRRALKDLVEETIE